MREQAWLKTALKARGLKLKDAAQRLSISPPRVTDVIKGMREVQSDEILPLANMLAMSPTRLLKSLEAGQSIPDDGDNRDDRLPVLGAITGTGDIAPADTLSFSSVPLPPDAATNEGLYCYLMGDESMATEVPEGSLVIGADPRLHHFPLVPGALLMARRDETVVLRRLHRTADGALWLVAVPAEPNPRYQSYRFDLGDPDQSAPTPGTENGATETVGIDNIFAGVLWVHHRRMPA